MTRWDYAERVAFFAGLLGLCVLWMAVSGGA